ncbi:HAD family hydrolase [Mycoplasmopsis gallopavonis]|uniref:Haloacid dehalogenase-like hydrolase n=1 Tax=Mycoplasmopsis gallopavonis TaxID=76629 RepID=A0A449AZY6_9BACT|nr:HAD family hydrolase [Mycoplasmopsis gallopavonis]VEU73073.1 haloacid dehalogenase-like hydrolase [Mycoplasmopsis gallopavonis]
MDKNQKNIKKFVFDLDGTLLTSDKKLTPETIKQVLRLQNEGHLVFIATGRPYYMNKQILQQLEIKMPVINANGASIYDPISKQLLFANTFARQDAQLICQILIEHQIDFLAYSTTMMFGYNLHQPKWFEKMIYSSVKNLENPYRWDYSEQNLENEMIERDFIKFLVLAEKIDPQILDQALAKIAKQVPKSYFVHSQSTVVDIMPHGSNKWESVKKALAFKNLDLDNLYCFGDAYNDFEMIKNSYFGIAMGNAVQEVKLVAKQVIDTNDNEGVAKFLVKL